MDCVSEVRFNCAGFGMKLIPMKGWKNVVMLSKVIGGYVN